MSSEYISRTSCRGCHGVCQVLVYHDGKGKISRITGDKESTASQGYICPKGAYATELVYHKDRITKPLLRQGVRGEGKWKSISWEEATDMIADRFTKIINESGPEYLAIAQGTGRPYMEFTTKFCNDLGSPNWLSPAHNCFVPRILCSLISIGWMPLPDIYNLGGEMPKCILMLGNNGFEIGAAGDYCGRMEEKAFDNAEKTIVLDPRKTRAARKSDIHMVPRPGSEISILLAMIHTIIKEKSYDEEFVENHCYGFEKLESHIQQYTPEWAEEKSHVEATKIIEAARAFSKTKPACIIWGNGIDMSVNAFQFARATYILMAICGTLDIPGGNVDFVPLGLKGDPPAFDYTKSGLRMVAGTDKNKLMGDFPFCPGAHPPSFWQACIDGKPYKPRGIWLVGTNPMLTATRGDIIQRALRDHLEFIVGSDFFITPSLAMADLVLPASHWLEQDCIGNDLGWAVHTRKPITKIGEVRDDRDVIREVARKMGLVDEFPWDSWEDYQSWRTEPLGMSFEKFSQKDQHYSPMKFKKYKKEGFRTKSGKVELYSTIMEDCGVSPLPDYTEPPVSPISTPDIYKNYPFYFISGCKSLEFFHSEGQNLKSQRKLNPDPLVEMNPDDASQLGLKDGQWIKVSTPWGSQKFRLKKTDRMPKEIVHAQHARWYPEKEGPDFGAFESNVNLLFPHDFYDPLNGAESLKSFLCRVDAF